MDHTTTYIGSHTIPRGALVRVLGAPWRGGGNLVVNVRHDSKVHTVRVSDLACGAELEQIYFASFK